MGPIAQANGGPPARAQQRAAPTGRSGSRTRAWRLTESPRLVPAGFQRETPDYRPARPPTTDARTGGPPRRKSRRDQPRPTRATTAPSGSGPENRPDECAGLRTALDAGSVHGQSGNHQTVRQLARPSDEVERVESPSWPHMLMVEGRPIGRTMPPCAAAVGCPA